ncbi:Rho GTPase activation protein [Obba rivulosa]|uniref:Rho GTPase activation protein n=1 Tax=Obba rivulosa TaxID=1052685 RepID=A0A8E2DV11_9APHY|nr:Rho GTPase activation protein [Obba rivulosa]
MTALPNLMASSSTIPSSHAGQQWDERSSTDAQEFYVSVELHVSPKAAATLRKPPLPHKKTSERHAATKSSSGSVDSTQKRLREKSSWLNLTRNPITSGQWRAATCKLVEEDEGCVLNIYLEEAILYKSIYIYLLNHTDIRPVHPSLFGRKNSLGIYCVAGQSWSAAAPTEPAYLHFPDTDAMNAWLALLRSYAMPEVYGRWLSPDEGGLYRMWRQIEMTVIQGRNLGISKVTADDPASGDPDPNSDAIDMDLYCEMHVNSQLCGRTTVKKGIGSPDWQERFTFSDLPPFENLEILIWREKKLMKPVLIGSVLIVLANFRRGEYIEGWFPVLTTGSSAHLQVGEVRLKLKVDEEIVLPYSAYVGILKTFISRNALDWMQDLETHFKLKTISSHIMSIAIAKNVLMDNIMELADREVDGTVTSHQTLFRGNTVLTKTIELFMAWYGTSFLEASIGETIRRLCADRVGIEVDPVRSGKSVKGIEKNVELLVYWCEELWTHIYEARRECPQEMRKLFEHIRHLVERRYRVDDQNREVPWQSVSAFCFLRFMVPAILHPHLFGLWPGLPDARVQRSLTLIAKVIQNLANLNTTVQKEEYMRGVKDFLSNTTQAMIDYIVVVSTPDMDHTTTSPVTSDRHERLRILNTLRRRGAAAPLLFREAVPLLPHMLDLPKHLAVLSSVVVRYSRTNHYDPTLPVGSDERPFKELCLRCMEVEEQALQRVSQLATKRVIKTETAHGWKSSSVSVSISSSSPISIPHRERKLSLTEKNERRKRSGRPSTAPSNDSTSVLSTSTPEKSVASHATAQSQRSRSGDMTHRQRSPKRSPHHPRSTSTDSVLARRTPYEDLSSTADASMVSADGSDVGKRKIGIFRAIWTRK